jgi:hypothetical protein
LAARRLFVVWLLAAVHCTAIAVDEEPLEAAIVFNMLLFVDWPVDHAPEAGGALTVCIEPGARLEPALQALDGRLLRQSRFEVREIDPASPLARCNALLLSAGSRIDSELRRRAAAGPVFVISDEALADIDLVCVHISMENGHMVFDVNQSPLRRSGLKLSSQLLRLARRVQP